MSSRNVYLTNEERKQALVLSSALYKLSDFMNDKEQAITFGQLKASVQEHIMQATQAEIDYVEVLSYPSLEDMDSRLPINQARMDYIVALAVKFGKTRLIDNRIVHWKGEYNFV
jgi:pantoate--beta-alanine ligase